MERIKKLFVFLWLLFIPTQLGLHFWPEWSHVMGLRIDYLAPTIYIWMGMVGIIFNFKFLIFNQIKRIFNFKFFIISFFILINIFVAGNRWEAGYKWMRIIQWIITFKLILNNKKLFKQMFFKVLPFWIIWESLLGLAQVVNGGSLNGIFYWLGERRFSYISLGVAQISWLGQGMIRAYGTFSHPNSMAGFLLVALIIFIQNKRHYWLYWSVVFCGLLGLFLSGSRTVWTILTLLFLLQLGKIKLGYVVMGVGLTIMALGLIGNNYRIVDFVGGWDSDGMANAVKKLTK